MAGVLYKILPDGRQPASLTPVATELSIWGTDEHITIPCVTSTKVIEIKEMIGARLGIDTGTLSFVTKQGCSYRTQLDWEEIRRKIIIKGIPSFTRQKKKYEHPMIILGAGHIGLRHGLWLLKYDCKNFIVIDRRNIVGGTSWITQANKTSKLQTELGAYHLQFDEANPVPTNMKTWPSRDELLEHFREVSEAYGLMPYVRLNTNVKQIDIIGKDIYEDREPLRFYLEKCENYQGMLPPEATGIEEEINGCCVAMYPGNLTLPRRETYKGEELFGGLVSYAIQNDVDYSVCTGEDVCILGHGAFGVENIRTCCEYSARRIYLVCRRKNLACPRVSSWFCNQSQAPIAGNLYMKSTLPMYDLIGVDPWTYHAVHANEARTNVSIVQKARFGIGDVYFLAIAMGKCEIVQDKVKRMSKGTVHLDSGRKLEVSMVLKLLGFEGDFEVDRLLRIKEMYGLWCNADHRRFTASEFPGVNANNFGGTSLSAGAITWVEQASHMLWYPKDWQAICAAGILPKHKAELDIGKPAYVFDARLGSSIAFLVPAFCPDIAERNNTVYSWLKHKKQWECHPMPKFVEECQVEWDEYAKNWYEQDPTLKPPPPYPYTKDIVQAFLDEEQENNRKNWEKQVAKGG